MPPAVGQSPTQTPDAARLIRRRARVYNLGRTAKGSARLRRSLAGEEVSMFTASLNLDALRMCAALGCGKPLPQELPQGAKFCSDECEEREKIRLAKASETSR